MNDCHISANCLPSFFEDLARRNFLLGHNSAKVTYLCKFCRHQCIQGCKYSCKSQWYCCRASSRDKLVVKRCIHQRLEKVEMTKSHGKCLKGKYFSDSPQKTNRMRKKTTTKKKTRKKRTKRKKKTKRSKMTSWRKKANRTRKKKTNRTRKKKRKKTWKKRTKRSRKKSKFRAKNTKNNNNDMKKTNKEKNSKTSGNNFSTIKHDLTLPF